MTDDSTPRDPQYMRIRDFVEAGGPQALYKDALMRAQAPDFWQTIPEAALHPYHAHLSAEGIVG